MAKQTVFTKTDKAIVEALKGAAKVNVYAMSGSSGEDRPLLLVGANGEVGRGTALGAPADGIIPAITYDVTEAGTYYIWSEKSGINVYYIEVVPEGAQTEGPARAAWNTVAAPVLGDATVENGTTTHLFSFNIADGTSTEIAAFTSKVKIKRGNDFESFAIISDSIFLKPTSP